MMKIQRPVLLLDKKKCEANLLKMLSKANLNNCRLEPHFKTHQSAEIGEWFRAYGIDAITVSSVKMAEYFVVNGWKKIHIAFPVNIHEVDIINRFSASINLFLLISHPEIISDLLKKLTSETGYFIEIDNGYHRTGVDADDYGLIEKIIHETRNSKLVFKGFHCHSGNTYQAKTPGQIIQIGQDTIRKLLILKNRYFQETEDLVISIGETPFCSLSDDFKGVDIIRPGNFIFYDIQQFMLGACRAEEIALALACPVVAVYRKRKEAVIYGGAVHLSKDFAMNRDGSKNYGLVCRFNGKAWDYPIPECFVKSLSQEHGVITFEDDPEFSAGDIVCILPSHACLTADCMRVYYTTDGEKIEMMQKS